MRDIWAGSRNMVTNQAHVELRGGRVEAPALSLPKADAIFFLVAAKRSKRTFSGSSSLPRSVNEIASARLSPMSPCRRVEYTVRCPTRHTISSTQWKSVGNVVDRKANNVRHNCLHVVDGKVSSARRAIACHSTH